MDPASAAVAEVLLFGGAHGAVHGDIFPVPNGDSWYGDAEDEADVVRVVAPKPSFRRVWREGQAVRSEMRLSAPVIVYT